MPTVNVRLFAGLPRPLGPGYGRARLTARLLKIHAHRERLPGVGLLMKSASRRGEICAGKPRLRDDMAGADPP
jgi:hypothetical protein